MTDDEYDIIAFSLVFAEDGGRISPVEAADALIAAANAKEKAFLWEWSEE